MGKNTKSEMKVLIFFCLEFRKKRSFISA